MVKIETGDYDSANLRVGVEHTMAMRTRIIRDTALRGADALADRAQRVDEQREVEVEERKGADRDVAGEHLVDRAISVGMYYQLPAVAMERTHLLAQLVGGVVEHTTSSATQKRFCDGAGEALGGAISPELDCAQPELTVAVFGLRAYGGGDLGRRREARRARQVRHRRRGHRAFPGWSR